MTEEIAIRIGSVLEKVQAALSRRSKDGCIRERMRRYAQAAACLKQVESADSSLPEIVPRVVAVSKVKPVSDIIAAYEAGQIDFGENYIQELEEKSTNPEIREKCKDIRWHFIGNLQRNKVGKLAAIPSLFMVETVSSTKLAQALNAACEKASRQRDKLKVMLQINSSEEDSKGGCSVDEVVPIATTVIEECPNLELAGLMTIGSFHHDLSSGPNPDFQVMLKCRERLCTELGLDVKDVELSMGMSADYEHAIEVGSTNVRIGSTIFGERVYPTKS